VPVDPRVRASPKGWIRRKSSECPAAAPSRSDRAELAVTFVFVRVLGTGDD